MGHGTEREEPAGADLRIAVLLAVCAVLAAAIGLRASTVNGNAGGDATSAVRGDVHRGSEIVQDATRIYAEDAPQAYQVAEADLRAAAATQAAAGATGIAREILAVEAKRQAALAKLLAEHSSTVVQRPGDATSLSSADLMRRLAEVRARYPGLVKVFPEADASAASDLRFKSNLLVAALIPISIGFLCGALAEGFTRLRGRLFLVGSLAALAGLAMAIVVELS